MAKAVKAKAKAKAKKPVKTVKTKAKTPAKKVVAKKAVTKKAKAKAPVKKAVTKKSAAKKPAAKKAAAKKPAAKKAAAKKAAAKKAPTKKAAAKKPAAKKSVAKKPVAKKGKAPVKKPVAKKAAPVKAKAPAKKPVAKKPAEAAPVKATAPAKRPAPAPFRVKAPIRRGAPLPVRPKLPIKQVPKIPVSKLPFSAGDSVVYPTHGVGRILAIEEQTISGHELQLYVIDFEQDRMKLRVPVQKTEESGLRKLSSRDRMKVAMTTLKGTPRVKRTMWSRRAQEYEAKINSGDPVLIAEVVRDLFRNTDQQEQSYSERQIYQGALDRLSREVAAVEQIAEDKASERLEDILKAPRPGA